MRQDSIEQEQEDEDKSFGGRMWLALHKWAS